MALPGKVTFDTKEFERLAKKVPGLLRRETKKVLKFIGNDFERKFIKRRLSGRPGLNRRSGNLARSVRNQSVVDEKGPVTARSFALFVNIGGPTAPYAEVHETGKKIKPKKKTWLAIPLPAAQTRAGVTTGAPRSFPNTFVQRSKVGNLIIFQKIGGGKTPTGRRRKTSLRPLFVLKKEVTIPRRLSFVKTWKASRNFHLKLLNEGIARVAKKVS